MQEEVFHNVCSDFIWYFIDLIYIMSFKRHLWTEKITQLGKQAYFIWPNEKKWNNFWMGILWLKAKFVHVSICFCLSHTCFFWVKANVLLFLTIHITVKTILEDCLNSILSTSPSVKIQIEGWIHMLNINYINYMTTIFFSQLLLFLDFLATSVY